MKNQKASYLLLIMGMIAVALAIFPSTNLSAKDAPEMRNVISEAHSLNQLARLLYANPKPQLKVRRSKVLQQPPLSYRNFIFRAAAAHQISPSLIAAVIKCESNWKATALSRKGARGLMQILPSTAKGEFGASSEDLWNPSINIYLGTAYLRLLANRYSGNSASVIAAYNAGPGRIDSGRPIPKETRRYMNCVHGWVETYRMDP